MPPLAAPAMPASAARGAHLQLRHVPLRSSAFARRGCCGGSIRHHGSNKRGDKHYCRCCMAANGSGTGTSQAVPQVSPTSEQPKPSAFSMRDGRDSRAASSSSISHDSSAGSSSSSSSHAGSSSGGSSSAAASTGAASKSNSSADGYGGSGGSGNVSDGSNGKGGDGSGGKGGGSGEGSSSCDPLKHPKWFQVWMWATALVYLVWRWQWRRGRRLAAEQLQREQEQEEKLDREWDEFAQRFGITREPRR